MASGMQWQWPRLCHGRQLDPRPGADSAAPETAQATTWGLAWRVLRGKFVWVWRQSPALRPFGVRADTVGQLH
jgi:hypothetical protein